MSCTERNRSCTLEGVALLPLIRYLFLPPITTCENVQNEVSGKSALTCRLIQMKYISTLLELRLREEKKRFCCKTCVRISNFCPDVLIHGPISKLYSSHVKRFQCARQLLLTFVRRILFVRQWAAIFMPGSYRLMPLVHTSTTETTLVGYIPVPSHFCIW